MSDTETRLNEISQVKEALWSLTEKAAAYDNTRLEAYPNYEKEYIAVYDFIEKIEGETAVGGV